MFSRISSEVCCQKCRKRLWRSEVEATRHDATEGAARLESRQKAREPCRCERFNRLKIYLKHLGSIRDSRTGLMKRFTNLKMSLKF